MAGLEDYEFYNNLRQKDSPFWQKSDNVMPRETEYPLHRPSGFPERLNPSAAHSPRPPPQCPSNDIPMEKYGEASITLISICAENLLSHPFIVLKRQCQVNVSSQRYHLQPITLIPALVHLQTQQGISAFWKGLGSILTVKGLTLALEDCVSKFTPWPKEISAHSSPKTMGKHLMLKCTCLALITPFYSASLVETVQSEITSERPGVFDVFKEGFYRLLSFTQPQTGRMLPVWLLIIPTVSHGILQYIIGNAVSTLTAQYLSSRQKIDEQKKGAISRDNSLNNASIRLHAACVGHLASDIILFPLETVLHRIHLQGTRTIIDSLDFGYEVKPILTKYEGFFDCFTTIVREEGALGLFKGFGALCLQYAAYAAALKFAHVIIREVTNVLAPPRPRMKPVGPVPALTPASPYAPLGSGTGSSASLHSSPLHGSRRRNNRDLGMHSGSVDLGDLSASSHPVDLRAEVHRYRDALESDA